MAKRKAEAPATAPQKKGKTAASEPTTTTRPTRSTRASAKAAVETKSESKPAPVAESKKAPKAAPKKEPKAPEKPAPKKEATKEAKAAPKAASKAAPKKAAKKETKKNSKKESKPLVLEEFDKNLFQDEKKYHDEYVSSGPYTHAVIQPLMDDALLRAVRSEIIENIDFTPKETDIYRIHQSGDLANLSGLDDESLKRLPSLLRLRNALYSEEFRNLVSGITGCGKMSGKKQDMAVNVYTKGCHLLNHDDVIGSRRVSYILYLTDPDEPWKPEWGGALRLYPTVKGSDGETRTPLPNWTKVIPPAWNQLSFFEVKPGESFHDVEEVTVPGKVRMAISGWFHIPQEGEDGYIAGLEEELAEKSSLQQLVSKGSTNDFPVPKVTTYPPLPTPESEDAEELEFTVEDLDFLRQYINPQYLTPDTLFGFSRELKSEASIQLDQILHAKFAEKLKAYILARDGTEKDPLPSDTATKEGWKVAKPPHKQRYLYLEAESDADENPYQTLLTKVFPSSAFRKWLSLATGLDLKDYEVLGRRFRRGLDYQLATGWEPEAKPDGEDVAMNEDGQLRVEVCLSLTPTSGWVQEEEPESEPATNGPTKKKRRRAPYSRAEKRAHRELLAAKAAEEAAARGEAPPQSQLLAAKAAEAAPQSKGPNPSTIKNKKRRERKRAAKAATVDVVVPTPPQEKEEPQEGGVGGYEMYMFADDPPSDAESDSEEAKDKPKSADPAIYQASKAADDAVAFAMPAAWNRMSIVLRDTGLLRFVKYVSWAAKGDRWDVVGAWSGEAKEGEWDESEDDLEVIEGSELEGEEPSDSDDDDEEDEEEEEEEDEDEDEE